ncbi:TPA: hypothetical protein DCX16_06755 [bacterium]|nr:hypothetical protein [bacterium]
MIEVIGYIGIFLVIIYLYANIFLGTKLTEFEISLVKKIIINIKYYILQQKTKVSILHFEVISKEESHGT